MHDDQTVILKLTVRNHPGVMSHVIGLFARRAYNVEGILCVPEHDGLTSQMWLLVHAQEKLDQIVAQTKKLVDVLSITVHAGQLAQFQQLSRSLSI
nr:ACT domain-containing protein [Vibrio stylophorae]